MPPITASTSRSRSLPPHRRGGGAAGLCLLLALAGLSSLLLGACDAAAPKVKTPAQHLYLRGQVLMDQELYTEAVARFQEVAEQNPGTLLGSYAYLQIAELRMLQKDWEKAETNFRLFLAANQNSHLTPYVLYRLAQVNHADSFTGLFFPTREVDRDQLPNREIIQEYQRFYFLYPKSIFLDEVRGFAVDARVTLAEHERIVADFYYRRGHFHAAAARYLYLLRTYPEYPRSDAVLDRLIQAYRRNQQPELAAEMERLVRRRPTPRAAGSGGDSADSAPPPRPPLQTAQDAPR